MTQRFRYRLFLSGPGDCDPGPVVEMGDSERSHLQCARLPGSDPKMCGRIDVLSFFDLTMVWNRGISFGIGQSEGIMRWLLVILTTASPSAFRSGSIRASRRFTGLALAW